MDPANKESHLLLATLLAGSPEPAARDEGLSKLLLLSTDRTAVGLEALTTLAKRGDLPKEKIRELIPLLQQHPLATEGHRLLAVDAEIALQPERREALIESAIAARKGADALVLRDLGIWLNAHKEFTRTLEVIPANVAIGRKDLFLVHVDALAARGRWVDLRKILESGEVPLDAAIKELYLARCATELHDPGLADIHWKRAQFAALRSPEQLVAIATYAEKVGNSDQAEIAYRTLASSSATARPAYLALMRLLQKKQDTAALRDLLRDMVALWPKDMAVRNDYAYLNLLLKKEAAQSMNIALELMAQNPLSLPHRTTLALAYLRVNQPEAALRVYNGLEVQWEKSPGSSRAVYAAVLAANGDKEKARDQIASLRFDTLRPEERELIKSLR
jgi:tetratricopeptide (TPR) repeat protein